MPWNDTVRAEHKRETDRYPTDLTDAEWEIIKPLLPPAKTGGRPRKTKFREVFNAIQTAANIQDRDGASALIKAIRYRFPWLRHLFADGAYSGPKLRAASASHGDWTIEIVKRSYTAKGFLFLPRLCCQATPTLTPVWWTGRLDGLGAVGD